MKEHFSNTSIYTRYIFNYYAVLEYMLYKYLVEKLMDKNENAPLKSISPHCGQEPVMLIFSFHLRKICIYTTFMWTSQPNTYLDWFPLISTYRILIFTFISENPDLQKPRSVSYHEKNFRSCKPFFFRCPPRKKARFML